MEGPWKDSRCHCWVSMLLSALVILLSSPQVEPATKWINSFAGPFWASVGQWRECPGKTEELVQFNLRISQFRNPLRDVQTKLQIVNGNISILHPLTNKGSIVLRAASRSNNQWKENAYVVKFNTGVCNSLTDFFPDFTRKIYKIESSDHRLGGKPCIIQKGIYFADDVPVNWTIPKLNVLPYGTWRVQVGFDLGTDTKPRPIACFMTEVTTHPKL